MLHCRIFSPHYVKVDKYRHYSPHYPVVSQWSKCQSLQIMSSQCLETRTVIYRSIFLVFFKVSFHNARLPLPLVSWRVCPTDESAFLAGLSPLGNSLRSTYQPRKRLPGSLLATRPGTTHTKRGRLRRAASGQHSRAVPTSVGVFLFLPFLKKSIS